VSDWQKTCQYFFSFLPEMSRNGWQTYTTGSFLEFQISLQLLSAVLHLMEYEEAFLQMESKGVSALGFGGLLGFTFYKN
jgi:hypothetical protein